MSLSRMFLRMLAVKAISGRTLAQDRVRDSDVSDLTTLMTNTPEPMIVVYTDDQTRTYKGKELYGTEGHKLLTFQISIAGTTQGEVGPDNSVVATAPGDQAEDSPTSFYVPSTSAGLEAMIDIIEAQILAALTDATNPWADLWADFVTGYKRSQSFRGASDQQGTRFAVRQFNIEVETLADPTPGRAATPTYARMIVALTTDADEAYTGIVPLLRAVVEGKPLTAIQIKARQAGVSRATSDFLALGNLPGDVAGGPVQGIDIDDADTGATTAVEPAKASP